MLTDVNPLPCRTVYASENVDCERPLNETFIF